MPRSSPRPPSDPPARPSLDRGRPDGEDTVLGRARLTRFSTRWGRLLVAWFSRIAGVLGEQRALVVTLAVGAAIAFLASFALARIYDAVTESEGIAGLDAPILRAAAGLRSPVVDTACGLVAEVFGPIGMPIIAIVAMAWLGLARRSWTPVILVAAAGVGSVLMTVAGKDIIGRSRPPRSDAIPPYESSPSFPSGHSLNSLVVLGVLAYLLMLRRHTTRARLALGIAAGVVSFAVGASRVILGAHWATDVLAAWALGAAWLAVLITAHRLLVTTQSRDRPRGSHPEPHR